MTHISGVARAVKRLNMAVENDEKLSKIKNILIQHLTLYAPKFKLPLMLYLSPYVDFSQITEVRFLVNQKGTSRISSCLRGQSMGDFQQVLSKITSFARKIAMHLPSYSHILDIAYLPNGNIRLVEVNPGLTPKDIKELQTVQMKSITKNSS